MKNTSNSSSNNDEQPHIPTSNQHKAGEFSAQKPHLKIPPTGEIRYRNALDDAGRVVEVMTLKSHENIRGRRFHCLACGEMMVARLGNQLAHHFAHQQNSFCSGETYLHQLAKRVFQEEFSRCMAEKRAFQIELPQRLVCSHHGEDSERICQTQPKLKVIDLVPDVLEIRVEKKTDEFVPDINLVGKSGRDYAWVEFAVTHPCSEAKLAAKKRIIEITIQDEADVELFRSHRLSVRDPRVIFIHFPERVANDMCHWYSYCKLKKRVILVDGRGKLAIEYMDKSRSLPAARLEETKYYAEEFIHRDDVPETIADYHFSVREAAHRHIADARQAGATIRVCDLCVHFDSEDGYCFRHSRQVAWVEALECSDFELPDYLLLPSDDDEL